MTIEDPKAHEAVGCLKVPEGAAGTRFTTMDARGKQSQPVDAKRATLVLVG
jgi:hypothetical protein